MLTSSSTTTRNAPYFDGIVRIGEFDGDKEVIALLPEGGDVTIEWAE